MRVSGPEVEPRAHPEDRFPRCCQLSFLPVFTWTTIDRFDLSELEAALDAAQRVRLAVVESEKTAITNAVFDACIVLGPVKSRPPSELAAEIRAAIENHLATPQAPPSLDTSDRRTRIALGVADGDEALARELLVNAEFAPTLDWLGAQLPPARLVSLARSARASLRARSSAPLTFAAVEARVSIELEADEAKAREALEAPAREAAARLASRAAELRARFLEGAP